MPNVRQPSETFYRFLGPKYRCAYCGEPSDTIDHTTPRWFIEGNLELLRRFWVFKVSSCRSCNGFAGNVVDRTFFRRKQRIARKLAKRARKLLQTADWPEDELEELGHMLRSLCEQADHDAAIVRRRLRFLADPLWPHGVPLDLQIRFVSSGETVRMDGDLSQGAEHHQGDGSVFGFDAGDNRRMPCERPIPEAAGGPWAP